MSTETARRVVFEDGAATMSHGIATSTTWRVDDIVGGLAADFDGSLSGLGVELGADTYNMSEALLALPAFKQETLESGFQCVLGAATSPATKLNEETLTYLNQGQSYEIKLKKLGDLSELQGKLLKSTIKVCFHERRLQFMEKEQIDTWKQTRPGERILDLDIPLSYGLVDVCVEPSSLNTVQVVWDPTKEAGAYIKVNCISTEFTAKKHGGEKGVPFRIQIETHVQHQESKPLHIASCQVKVFKPKGADRKHKTDREKMEKRSGAEKEKYQPSYECTVLREIPVDQLFGNSTPPPDMFSNLSISKNDSFNSVSDLGTPTGTSHSPDPSNSCTSPLSEAQPLTADASSQEVMHWLQVNRFSSYIRVFQQFSGADLLRLSREDLIEICGLADGIRLNNALQLKAMRPRLTVYVVQDTQHVYHAVYLENLTVTELQQKIANLFSIKAEQILEIYVQGPSGIHVLVTDEVVQNVMDQTRYLIDALPDEHSTEHYRVLLKPIST